MLQTQLTCTNTTRNKTRGYSGIQSRLCQLTRVPSLSKKPAEQHKTSLQQGKWRFSSRSGEVMKKKIRPGKRRLLDSCGENLVESQGIRGKRREMEQFWKLQEILEKTSRKGLEMVENWFGQENTMQDTSGNPGRLTELQGLSSVMYETNKSSTPHNLPGCDLFISGFSVPLGVCTHLCWECVPIWGTLYHWECAPICEYPVLLGVCTHLWVPCTAGSVQPSVGTLYCWECAPIWSSEPGISSQW